MHLQDIEEKQLSLMDPRFNLREIIKQMLLLEQHLCDPAKRCPDCICKHIMTIEALAEEGAQLDQTGRFIWLNDLAQSARHLEQAYLQNGNELCSQLAVGVRQMRKKLFGIFHQVT